MLKNCFRCGSSQAFYSKTCGSCGVVSGLYAPGAFLGWLLTTLTVLYRRALVLQRLGCRNQETRGSVERSIAAGTKRWLSYRRRNLLGNCVRRFCLPELSMRRARTLHIGEQAYILILALRNVPSIPRALCISIGERSSLRTPESSKWLIARDPRLESGVRLCVSCFLHSQSHLTIQKACARRNPSSDIMDRFLRIYPYQSSHRT